MIHELEMDDNVITCSDRAALPAGTQCAREGERGREVQAAAGVSTRAAGAGARVMEQPTVVAAAGTSMAKADERAAPCNAECTPLPLFIIPSSQALMRAQAYLSVQARSAHTQARGCAHVRTHTLPPPPLPQSPPGAS